MSGAIELDIPALCVRWKVNNVYKLDENERILSSEFTFQGWQWRLRYYLRYFHHRLVLEQRTSHRRRLVLGRPAPFDVSVHVAFGDMRPISTKRLSQKNRFRANKAKKVIWSTWDLELDFVPRDYPAFYRGKQELRFLVRLEMDMEDVLRGKNSVATQTKCSVPEGAELSCMDRLSEDFARLMVQGSDTDVEFRCADRSFRVHGVIVCARSPVIATMLASDMVEGRTRIINIPDMTLEVFRHFLRYIYSGKLPSELTFEVAWLLYESADQYAVLGLARRCSGYLVDHLSDQNACDVLVLADAHSDGDFVEEVVDCMVDRRIPRSSDRLRSFCDEHPRLAKKVLSRLCNLIPIG